MLTEIAVFHPNSRKRHMIIESLIPQQCVDVLKERLGTEVAEKAQRTINSMKRNDMDLTQFRIASEDGDRRVRIRLG